MAQVADDNNRSWLSKVTLGLIETNTPLPPGETRANQDVLKQYQDAKDAIPSELLPANQDEVDEQNHQAEGNSKDRSWFSYMTLGIFD